MERVFIIPQYLLYYVEKIMLYHFSKSIKSFKSFFNYMYWILKLYTNIHCEKFNVPLSFNNDISWKFLKIMTFFMCFTLLIKSKFTIDNLIRGMDRGGSLKLKNNQKNYFSIFFFGFFNSIWEFFPSDAILWGTSGSKASRKFSMWVKGMFRLCNNIPWLQALQQYQTHGVWTVRKNRTHFFEKTVLSPAFWILLLYMGKLHENAWKSSFFNFFQSYFALLIASAFWTFYPYMCAFSYSFLQQILIIFHRKSNFLVKNGRFLVVFTIDNRFLDF